MPFSKDVGYGFGKPNLAYAGICLGLLEDAVIQIAGITGSPDIVLGRRGCITMCADNGIVAEGVAQSDASVTTLVAGNIARGYGSVCRMASVANADVTAVDIGMVTPADGVLDRRIAAGTANMTQGPAMTRKQAIRALCIGIELVADFKSRGYQILATGEMGIGNTSTSSALVAAFLGISAAEATGRGAGLSDEGLHRKIDAIERALAVNHPDPSDALDVLSKVGGFDIAGMAGIFLGGAIHRVPILIDGFVSAAAALVAAQLRPESTCAMIATHISAEPASRLVLNALGVRPLICADMRLGEGTGAVCALPLLDMALAVYNEMVTFDDIALEAYIPQGGDVE